MGKHVGFGARLEATMMAVATAAGALGGCFPIYGDGGWDGDFTFDSPVDERPVVTAERTPPAISGGTLIVSRDGRTAIAADPDRDRVYRVDLRQNVEQPLLSTTILQEGDEPGRVVEDPSGRIHVVLRRGGAIASFDPAFPQDVTRAPVCAEPRGLLYDEEENGLVVACTSGDLVTMTLDGRELRRTDLGNDLRDVVKVDGRMYTTRFRAAELVEVDADGSALVARDAVSTDYYGNPQQYDSAVAWRTVAMPDGRIAMTHQLGFNDTLPQVGYYSLVTSTGVTTFDQDGNAQALNVAYGVLPVDIAVSADGSQVAVAYAGSNSVAETSTVDGYNSGGYPIAAAGVIAVAYASAISEDGSALVYQTREPAQIAFTDGRAAIPLHQTSVADTGHEIFHADSGMGVACASCHPEGREDGRTWLFPIEGARRTQNIAGGVLESAPFHWAGDIPNIDAFLGEVFTNRMGGTRLSQSRVSSVARFVESFPAPVSTTSASAESVARGKAIFESQEAECATCHFGPRMSNERTVDVGTGEALQVPTLLGVGLRGPWMHDGCATTLEDRFGGCGGERHGDISDLSDADVRDIVAYLETL